MSNTVPEEMTGPGGAGSGHLDHVVTGVEAPGLALVAQVIVWAYNALVPRIK